MWSTEHIARSNAPADAVWAVWADVAGYPRWNPTIAAVSFDGQFLPGATGSLEHVTGRKSNFELGEIHPKTDFTVLSRLAGARLQIKHEVEDVPEQGSRLTQRAVLDGMFAGLWSLLLRRQLTQDIAEGVEAAAREAERSGYA